MTSSPFFMLRRASRTLRRLDATLVNDVLWHVAGSIEARTEAILAANATDCSQLGKEDPQYDRLLLSKGRLKGIADDIRSVAGLPSPLNLILEERTLPSGLHLQRVTVPLGVVGIVYEARPNVTFDVFSLCFKAGNAVALKGGSDAEHSNAIGVQIIKDVLTARGIDPEAIHLLPPGREAVATLLNAVGEIDVVIPRGSRQLIDRVRAETKVPVIETGAGVCHTYVDATADALKAASIVFNAKTRRPTVCNALDCLIIHQGRLAQLPSIAEPLAAKNVVIFADSDSYRALHGHYPQQLLRHAGPEHFGAEFLSLRMAIKTVTDFPQALEHIAEFGSGHSEAIVAEDKDVAERFLREVDAAAVYANASTAFSDGAQFGLGAEIGISTQKLHARGPMGLRELTSYKWILRGHGEIRPLDS
ncbi:MAG: glutamate-5-semialdehyde dehydrogenase [Steroidobacteraceae bacterium]